MAKIKISKDDADEFLFILDLEIDYPDKETTEEEIFDLKELRGRLLKAIEKANAA